jgi:hypothetical protein
MLNSKCSIKKAVFRRNRNICIILVMIRLKFVCLEMISNLHSSVLCWKTILDEERCKPVMLCQRRLVSDVCVCTRLVSPELFVVPLKC